MNDNNPHQHLQDAEKLVNQCHKSFVRNKPLVLIVQYQHETDKHNFIRTITHLLKAQQYNVNDYDLYQNRQYDQGGLYQQFKQDSQLQTLSIISAWPQAKKSFDINPEFITYLNLHRDLISKHQLRLILFIHQSNMAQFTYGAADLKSFSRNTFWLDHNQDNLWTSTAFIPVRKELEHVEPSATADELQQYLARGKQLLAQQQTPEDKLQVLQDISGWLHNKGFSGKALEFAQQCEQLIEEHQLPTSLEFEAALGFLYFETKQPRQAKTHLENALALAKQSDDNASVSMLSLMLLSIEVDLSELDESTDPTDLVTNILSELDNNTNQKFEQTTKILKLLIKNGKYNKSLHIIDKNLAHFSENPFISGFLNQQKAFVLSQLEDHHQALSYLLKAKLTFQKYHQYFPLLEVYLDIAENLIELNELDKALVELTEARNIAAQDQRYRQLCDILYLTINILGKRGDYQKALVSAKELLNTSRLASWQQMIGLSYFYAAMCQFKLDHPEQAKEEMLNAYKIAQQQDDEEFLTQIAEVSEKYGMPNGLKDWQALLKQRELNNPDI